MSNEKKQIKQSVPILGVCALVILIVGCLWATNPVKALNPTSPVPGPTGEATSQPTAEPTIEPTLAPVVLSINGPNSVIVGEAVHLRVEVRGVTGQGLYGAQLEINFDPSLLSVSNMQVNPDFSFILQSSADNTLGQISLVASRQGSAAGLTGDVTLFTFDATALSGEVALLNFENVKMGDPQAQPFTLTSAEFSLFIDNEVFPTPVDEPPPAPTNEPTAFPTNEPTPEPTTDWNLPPDEPPPPTDQPTALPTDEPTPEPTDEGWYFPPDEPPPPTDQPTATPTGQPTAQPTNQPTASPIDGPTAQPTGQPTLNPSGEPTWEPTAEPAPLPGGEPTSPATAEPGNTIVLGQIVLTGRANNDWSAGTVTLDDTGQNATSDIEGRFTIAGVAAGSHASITADASGYLPAVCTTVTISTPETALATINLISGDINDDTTVDIADATAIGVSFGQTGPNLTTDINHNESTDIFDLILVSVSFGQGSQTWSCLSQPASLLGVE